jgi:hypothetical protein
MPNNSSRKLIWQLGAILVVATASHIPANALIAGNANTLAALWRILDDATQNLMIRFFLGVKRGLSHSAALALSEREKSGLAYAHASAAECDISHFRKAA